MYLLFLLLMMIVFTVYFSVIISKTKGNGSLASKKLTDNVEVIDNIDNNVKKVIVDEDII